MSDTPTRDISHHPSSAQSFSFLRTHIPSTTLIACPHPGLTENGTPNSRLRRCHQRLTLVQSNYSQQPVSAQPGAVAGMDVRNVKALPFNEKGTRDWSNGTFSCIEDPATFVAPQSEHLVLA